MVERKQLIIEGSAVADRRPSGVGYSIINLINALSSSKKITDEYDIQIIIPTRQKKYIRNNISLKNVRVRKNYLQNRVINVLNYLGLLPPMDLIYGGGTYFFPNYKNWPLTSKSRSITLIHDLAFLLYPDTVEPRNQVMLARNVPKWVHRTNRVVTVSNTSRQEVIDNLHLSSDKVITLYNIVSTYRSEPPLQQSTKVRNKYRLPPQYILTLSTIEPRKNLVALLDVYDYLGNQFKRKYPLVICGGVGWEQQPVIDRLNRGVEAGWIIRPGYIDDEDKSSLLRGAKLFVHPAIHEGFGLPPLEAIQAGATTIVNNIPVMKEILGSAAIYADFANKKKAAEIIEYTLIHPNKPNQQVVKSVMQRYTPESVVRTFRDIINSVKG